MDAPAKLKVEAAAQDGSVGDGRATEGSYGARHVAVATLKASGAGDSTRKTRSTSTHLDKADL